MRQLHAFFTAHWAILLTSSVMAFVILSPSFLYPLMDRESYRGIDIGSWVDYSYYLGKGREILEGHSLGNNDLQIGKDASTDPHQVYIEYLFLGPIRLAGLGDIAARHITGIYYTIAFFGILALALLIYFFIFRLSLNTLLSAAIALFTIGGYTLVKLSHDAVTMERPDFNMFVRPIIPLYGLIALFVYLHVLLKSIASDRRKYVWWAGAAFGALFYVYPYTWTFALALTGSVLLIYIFLRDVAKTKNILIIMVLGLAIGSYTLVKTYTFSHSDVGKQILYYAIEDTGNRAPAPMSKLSLLTLALLGAYAYRNRKDAGLPLLFAIVASSWICLNQQVLTGKSPQIMHYFWYVTIPTSIVVGFYAGWSFLSSVQPNIARTYGTYALYVVIFISFFTAARQQYVGTVATIPLRQHAQNYKPIFNALRRDPLQGVVLISQAFFGKYVIVYTHHDFFWHNQAIVFNTPWERIMDALYVYAYLDREARHDFLSRLKRFDTESSAGEYGDNRQYPLIYQYVAGFWSGYSANAYSLGLQSRDPSVLAKRDEALSRLFEGYAKVATPKGITDILKKSNVNYIVWDKQKNPTWDLSFLSGSLREVAVSNDVYLYKIVW